MVKGIITSSNTCLTVKWDSNKFYTNYSTFRSPNGLNQIGDFTFVGTEILENATPTIDGATTVTNYGEILADENTRKLWHI